ncbi:MAG: hypothetical protein Kow0062_00530 [Acidobacteriota bacterium]
MARAWLVAALACLAPVASAPAGDRAWIDAERTAAVDPARGVDPRVDYAALLEFGPWDDRNYLLTSDDLAALGADAQALRGPLPAFFRVALHRALPSLRECRKRRYPTWALNVYLSRYGGYLVDGRLHTRVRRESGRFLVVTGTAPEAAPDGSDGLVGEARLGNEPFESESALAIHPLDPARLVAGTVRNAIEQKMYWSPDGGATWNESPLPLEGGCCDPAVGWSADGGSAYAAMLGNCSVFGCELHFYRSDDGGISWTGLESVTPGSPRRVPALGADRDVLHVDRSPRSPWHDRIWIAYADNGVISVLRSDDRGNGWQATALSAADADLGVGADLATTRDGTLHVTWPAYDSGTIRHAVSTDGGVTFSTPAAIATTTATYSFAIPSQDSREVRLYATLAADVSGGTLDGALYVAWTDATAPTVFDPAANHALVRIARSHDGGATWQVNSPHRLDDVQQVDRWHPALAVGEDGTVHVVFYDTRNSPDRSGVDVYYAYSTDGAASWSAPRRVTAETSPNIEHTFEFGDYGDLDIVLSELVASYTDNRSETGIVEDSVDVYAAGITPGSGQGAAGRTRGSKDVPGTPLTVTPGADGVDVDLAWDTACGAATDYAVYEGPLADLASRAPVLCSTGGATAATVTPGPGSRYWLVVAAVDGAEGSYGRSSDGSERAPAEAACRPQRIGACP